ncbi:14431_t:CDS:2 [Entrophospora sp. SA101]|nr:14431_t:CDS:2 [Entrophospora sp. SA101]
MEALDLLIASDELLLTELSEYIQNDLLVNGFAWLEKNSIIVWEKIYKYESCVKLQDYCIKLICKDPIKYLFASTEFLSMDEKTLSEFLKLDGLEIEEIELWNNILKWGLAQNPYLLLHDNNNNDNFDLLASTLNNLIPLITISQISSTDFHNKIWPFRYILPDKMFEEIMTYHLNPMSPPLPVVQAKRFQFDSSLLRPNHIALISSWIDRLDQKSYTYYKITEDSFLFSFGNRWKLEDARLSRVLHQRSFYAIRFNGNNYGPCFGDKDLCMKGCFNESGSCSAQKDDYCTSITDCSENEV